MFLLTVSLFPLPFIHGGHGALSWVLLLLVLAVLAIGSSLTRPPVFGLISILTPPHEQGATIGVAQSAGSLARIVGPVFASTLFGHHPSLPYVICGAISLLTGMFAWQSLCRSEEPLTAPQHG